MAHESIAISHFLKTVLSGDATITGIVAQTVKQVDYAGLYRNVAPQEAPLPYIVWNVMGADDVQAAGSRALANVVMQVQVVSVDGDGDSDAETLAQRIDALLEDAHATQGGVRLTVKSAGTIPEYTEMGDGVRYYRHQGRFWRFTGTV